MFGLKCVHLSLIIQIWCVNNVQFTLNNIFPRVEIHESSRKKLISNIYVFLGVVVSWIVRIIVCTWSICLLFHISSRDRNRVTLTIESQLFEQILDVSTWVRKADVVYMAHNIHVKVLIRKYTLGLPGMINKLGVRGQRPTVRYKWILKNRVHVAVWLCCVAAC